METSQVLEYLETKDRKLFAFQYLLNCSSDRIADFIDMLSLSDGTDVDPEFIWAAQAIEAMAEG